jgi:transcriptional regulator with XRE-family HTH domain
MVMAARKKRRRGFERINAAQFAKKYRYDYSHISRVLRGTTNVSVRMLAALAKELGKDMGTVAKMLAVADARKPRPKMPNVVSAEEYYGKANHQGE